MFRTERQDAILDQLSNNGRVATVTLANSFKVSEDSIRKDLQQLAAEGKLKRVYGGAVRVDEAAKRRVDARVDDYSEQKREVAAKAYGLIQNDQTVFLDISSTNLYLADLVAQGPKHVIVVSNMLGVLKRVASGSGVQAQCPGGTMNAELSGLVGAATSKMLQNMSFDLAFIGALGISVDRNAVSTFDLEDGTVKQTVLAASSRSYVVADSHKFSQRGNYRFARISDFTGIITDSAGESQRDAVEALGTALL